MEALLLYLLKANVVLALFAAAYYGLLRRLTFFELNRAYLLLALGFAAVYPLLPVPALLPAGAAAPLLPTASQLPAARLAHPGQPDAPFPWLLVGGGVYALGASLLLLRLLMQLLSLALVWVRARPAVVLGQLVRVVPGASGPFSFGTTIYLSAATLAEAAGLPAILRHEQAHVRQWHTLDVLLTQVAVALAWLNPAAWLLRRAVLDNLEYLADRAALQTGLDRQAYQYSLLHQQPGGVPVPALAFHFSFSTLKNRIVMLNQPVSTTRQLGRYLLAAPLVVVLALGYAGARAQTAPVVAEKAAKAPLPKEAIYYIDAKRIGLLRSEAQLPNPANMASMQVLEEEAAKRFDPTATTGPIIFITTKAQVNNPEVVALNAKLGAIAPVYTTRPVTFAYVQPKALAYITSHYPAARLIDVTEYKRVGLDELKYQVQLAEGRRPFYAYFTPQGDFLAEERH